MALNKVQPGDLITAQLMNDLIEKVNKLEERLALIEVNAPEDGPPTGIRLDAQPVAPGGWAILLGQTLGASKRTLQIRFGTAYVMEFDAAMFTDVAVRFRVPDLSFEETEKTYTMTVANHRGQAQMDVVVKRPLVPLSKDDFVINYFEAVPPIPAVGSPAAFRFRIQLSANRPASLTLDAWIARTGQPNLPITVQDDDGVNLPNKTLQFAGFDTKFVRLPVSQVPTPPFRLVLSSRTEGVTPFDFEHPITNLAESPDKNISLKPATARAARPGQAAKPFAVTDTGETCEANAPAGTTKIFFEIGADVTSPVTPHADQTYTYTITHVNGTPDEWTIDPASGSIPVSKGAFEATSGVVGIEIEPAATPKASPSDKSHYLLTVQRTGDTKKQNKILVLSRS